MPSARSARMRASTDGATGRRPTLVPFALVHARQPGIDALADYLPLELREHAHHQEQRLAGRRRGVDSLLVQIQVDAKREDLVEPGDQIL